MTYAASETSVAGGAPVELYRFALQGQSWCYTSADTAQAYNSQTYEPVPIVRSEPTQDKEVQTQELKVTLPPDDPVALLFQQGAPAGSVALVIYRFHRAVAEVLPFWTGRVRGCVWNQDGKAELQCEPVYCLLKRQVLRYHYQRSCNHMLYSPQCGLTRGDWATVGTVTGISGQTITAAEFASKADGWFKAGLVSWGYQRRMVIAHVGQTLTLLTPFEGLNVGAVVTAYAGCDHTLGATGCGRFNNYLNYGGFPYVPGINPFNGVL
jgi:uncharacterized phage protein (TIGR02218 family)